MSTASAFIDTLAESSEGLLAVAAADLERPAVQLIDARQQGLDEAGLRARARALSDAAGAGHVSRSYSFPYALVVAHSERVGVDIERIRPCDAAFARSICTPAEVADIAAVADPNEHFTSLWSSKEALAKALGDALAYDPQRLESPALWVDGRAGVWRAAELRIAAGHVGWLCWRAAAPAP